MPTSSSSRVAAPSQLTYWFIAVLVGLWGVAVIGGLSALLIYKRTPGQSAETPLNWPAESSIVRSANENTLLFFAHPLCPCTRATLREMEQLLAKEPKLTPQVVFYCLPGIENSWRQSDIVDRASHLPRAKVHWDHDGQLARLFGVTTSGHVILYDRDGKLSYTGGITGLRGHEGDNRGLEILQQAIAGEHPPLFLYPVLGCPIGNCYRVSTAND